MRSFGAGRRRHFHATLGGALSLDGGAGNDSFNFTNTTSDNLARGGDGNDTVFIADGRRNKVSGDAGNDWIGIGGGANAITSVLDGGDGDDFIGAGANSNWLLGGNGNDMLQAIGASNALVGGDGNDQLQANGDFNTLDGGSGNDSLFIAGG